MSKDTLEKMIGGIIVLAIISLIVLVVSLAIEKGDREDAARTNLKVYEICMAREDMNPAICRQDYYKSMGELE